MRMESLRDNLFSRLEKSTNEDCKSTYFTEDPSRILEHVHIGWKI